MNKDAPSEKDRFIQNDPHHIGTHLPSSIRAMHWAVNEIIPSQVKRPLLEHLCRHRPPSGYVLTQAPFLYPPKVWNQAPTWFVREYAPQLRALLPELRGRNPANHSEKLVCQEADKTRREDERNKKLRQQSPQRSRSRRKSRSRNRPHLSRSIRGRLESSFTPTDEQNVHSLTKRGESTKQ